MTSHSHHGVSNVEHLIMGPLTIFTSSLGWRNGYLSPLLIFETGWFLVFAECRSSVYIIVINLLSTYELQKKKYFQILFDMI